MGTQTYELIRNAIDAKKNITGTYKSLHRVMTPHTLGLKNNEEQCLCYQFDGDSSSASSFPANSPDNWRCVKVADLHDVKIIDGELHTCDQHTKDQTCVDEVETKLEF